MKKLIIGIIAVLGFTLIQPAQAEDHKVLAIIDSAIDSNKVTQVIHEVCFTSSKSMGCPNGQLFMEGKGSAASTTWPISMLKPVYHGHNVAQAALATNPNLKIVFVRMANITKGGDQAAFELNPLVSAIEWVSANAEKYSIDAVSISQSSDVSNTFLLDKTYGLKRTQEYDSSCVNVLTVSSVSLLKSKNIPVFAATGNHGSLDKVGFPACVSGVIGVGAFFAKSGILEKATNKGLGLDVVAPNSISVVRYNGTTVDFSATSAATPIAAAVYLNQNSSFELFINNFTKVLGYPYISK